MKKLLLTCCLFALAGCATVQTTSPGAMLGEDRLLVIHNDGYELLWLVPLWSGALEWDEQDQCVDCSPVFFENNADTAHLYDMATKIARRDNCELVNVTFIDAYMGLNPRNLYGLFKAGDVTLSAILRPKQEKEVAK